MRSGEEYYCIRGSIFELSVLIFSNMYILVKNSDRRLDLVKQLCLKEIQGFLWNCFSGPHVQGGSNMTGTNCDLFTHN